MNGAITKDHVPYDSICRKCPESTNPQKQKINQWFQRGWQGLELKNGGLTNGYRVSSGEMEISRNGDGCTTLNTLNNTELYKRGQLRVELLS